jgi:hypothetical protein
VIYPRKRLLFVLVTVLASACGYHFAASGSGLPTQAKTIYVETFGNHTRFTGINDEFTRYMKDEIANHKRLALVDGPQEADLILTGEVMYKTMIPGAANTVGEPITYAQSLSANAKLTDSHTHAVIWQSQGLSAQSQNPAVVAQAVVTTSPYFVQQNVRAQDIAKMPDIQVAETQNSASQSQMMEDLAQNIYSSMSEGF